MSNANLMGLEMPAKVPEWRGVDLETFRNEIVPRDRPAVMRGLIGDWPVVRAARQSPQAFYDYMRGRDQGRPTQTFIGAPAINGNFFYRDDMSGLNFEQINQPFHTTIAMILKHMDCPDPPAMYAPAASAAAGFSRFVEENVLGLLDKAVVPRLWVGNKVVALTHYDMSDGVACVAAGRKRFTLFPPDQLRNLYVGPLDLAPGGMATSMVKVSAPDLERYPRFADAWAVAEAAELEAGDAIFIPNLWWHNVESLDPLNLLVNYWWFDAGRGVASPFTALVMGLMAIPMLPASRREMWRAMFNHYVFQTDGDPVPYLPPDRRGMLGPMSIELKNHIREQLIRSLVESLSKPQVGQILNRVMAAL